MVTRSDALGQVMPCEIPGAFSDGEGFGRSAIGLGLALALFSSRAGGQPLRDTASDTWEATDGLGRSLPSAEEVGAPQPRQVLMFITSGISVPAATTPTT